MMDFKAMGQRIREERKLRGMTQEQLAELLNVSTEHLSRIETGAYRPSLTLIEKAAAVLEMDEADIMFGTLSDQEESRRVLNALLGLSEPKRQAAEQIINILASL